MKRVENHTHIPTTMPIYYEKLIAPFSKDKATLILIDAGSVNPMKINWLLKWCEENKKT